MKTALTPDGAVRQALQGPYCFCETPIGLLQIVEDGQGICSVRFADGISAPGEPEPGGVCLAEAKRQLSEYFAGKRREFDLPLSTHGSEFQERVWKALLDVPYGGTRSYQEVARAIGDEKAVRAVGMANRRNPIPILIPCHRVVGKDGALVGYAWGLERKRYLLDLEKRMAPWCFSSSGPAGRASAAPNPTRIFSARGQGGKPIHAKKVREAKNST